MFKEHCFWKIKTKMYYKEKALMFGCTHDRIQYSSVVRDATDIVEDQFGLHELGEGGQDQLMDGLLVILLIRVLDRAQVQVFVMKKNSVAMR